VLVTCRASLGLADSSITLRQHAHWLSDCAPGMVFLPSLFIMEEYRACSSAARAQKEEHRKKAAGRKGVIV